MSVLRYWRIGLGAAVMLGVSLAVAQPATFPECTKKPSPADVEGAKGAHKAASQFYDRGDYDKAIRYWGDAYAFDCTANPLLINMANAYEKKGDIAGAVAALETYLKRMPNADSTIEEKVKNLKNRLKPAASAVPTAPTATSTAPNPPPSGSAVNPPPEVPEGPRPYGITPWILVGGGGASLLAGVILLPVGYGAISSAAKHCTQTNGVYKCSDSKYASQGTTGRAEAGAGWATLSIGIGAAAAGLVWQFVANKPKEAAKTGLTVAPVVGLGQTGVSVGGAF